MDNSSSGKSALGLDGNIAALIGYIIGIVALILIFIEKDNKFVRFHALQSVFYHVGFIALMIVLSIVVGILAQISSVLGFLGLLLLPLWLVYFVGIFFLAYKGYSGSDFKVPIVGNIAEGMANK